MNFLNTIFCVSLFAFYESFAYNKPDWPEHCPKIISKKHWNGRKPLQVDYAITPVRLAIICETSTPECNSESSCSNSLKSIQNGHMDILKSSDISFTFLIGGDGNVYEGSGWHKVARYMGVGGSEIHDPFTLSYETKSISLVLAFIGDFTYKIPNKLMLETLKRFLECAVELEELDKNYTLLGPRPVYLLDNYTDYMPKSQIEIVTPTDVPKPLNKECCSSKSYELHLNRVTFAKAFFLCNNMGAELATPLSRLEQEEIEKLIFEAARKENSKVFAAWIGGIRCSDCNNNPREFVWLPKGRQQDYKHYEATMPDNYKGEQHCLTEIYHKNRNKVEWDDNNCQTRQYFICQTCHC